MTSIYMIRHCESEGNCCRRCHAQFDGIITRKGQLQSEHLVKVFKDVKLDAIYSSDSYRARKTAEPLAKDKGLEINYRMLLREYTIGTWEGQGMGNIALDHPDLWQLWTINPAFHHIPGADDFERVAERGKEIILRMAHENRNGSIAAITHSCTLTCTLTKLLGEDISYYKKIKNGDNTAITLIEVDDEDRIKIKYINDDSHLPEELRRSEYPGKSTKENLYLEYMSIEEGEKRLGIETGRKTNNSSLILASIEGKPHGYAIIEKGDDEKALITSFTLDEDTDTRIFCFQLFGGVIDKARRDGYSYVSIRKNGNHSIDDIIERFLFECDEDNKDCMKLKITVDHAEGPVL